MVGDAVPYVMCIMRAENKDTGQIKEHVYKTAKRAVQRLTKYMDDGNWNVIVANHESITLLTDTPDDYFTDDD